MITPIFRLHVIRKNTIVVSFLSKKSISGVKERGQRKLRSELGEMEYGCMDNALRHIFPYMAGDTQEDHLAAAAWNLNCAVHLEETMLRRP